MWATHERQRLAMTARKQVLVGRVRENSAHPEALWDWQGEELWQ
jgi:hypothetical protein